MKNKNIILLITVLLVGILAIGGTYAYFVSSLQATNNSYVTETHCLDVNYTDNTDQITGTLFPSGNALGGLSGNISVNIDQACELIGRGTLYIHIDSNTSSTLVSTVPAHCEVEHSLETLTDYQDQASCEAATGTNWVTNGTALKYAVLSGTHLYASGYITSTDIGADKPIYDDFSVTGTTKNYNIYVWLDGNLSDDTYTDLPFVGTSKLRVVQVRANEMTFTGDTPLARGYSDYYLIVPNYQIVEYIQSTGTQYIDTGIKPTPTTDIEVAFKADNANIDYQRLYGQDSNAATTRYQNFQIEMNGTNTTKWQVSVGEKHQIFTFDASSNFRTIKLVSGTGFYVDGTLLAQITQTETNNYSIWLFRGHNRYSALKISSAKLWQDGTLVRDFVPCYRRNDNVVGLYDLVNDVFYTNVATTGDDFTPGPEV